MKSVSSPAVKAPAKAPTGITGFDEITGGGLPCGRTTLLVGGPGSGKTILALQFLVQGAQACKEPGIFVAFEEASKRIEANAESFGWKLDELRRRKNCSSWTPNRCPTWCSRGFRSGRDVGGAGGPGPGHGGAAHRV